MCKKIQWAWCHSSCSCHSHLFDKGMVKFTKVLARFIIGLAGHVVYVQISLAKFIYKLFSVTAATHSPQPLIER